MSGPHITNMEKTLTPQEQYAIGQSLESKATIIGGPETAERKMKNFLGETKTNEFIISLPTLDHSERLRSYEILGEIME